jgi:hypothetical protein
MGLVLKELSGKSITSEFIIHPTDSTGVSFIISNASIISKEEKIPFKPQKPNNIEIEYLRYPEINPNLYVNKNYQYIDGLFGLKVEKDLEYNSLKKELEITSTSKIQIDENLPETWDQNGFELIFKKGIIYKNIHTHLISPGSNNVIPTKDPQFCLMSKKITSASRQSLFNLIEEMDKSKVTIEKMIYMSDLSKDNTIKEELKLYSYNFIDPNNPNIINYIPSPKSIISLTFLIETLYCNNMKYINNNLDSSGDSDNDQDLKL